LSRSEADPLRRVNSIYRTARSSVPKHPLPNEQEKAGNGKMQFLQPDCFFRTCKISRCNAYREGLSGILS
jgi:hypothetical protein